MVITNILKIIFRKPYNHSIILQVNGLQRRIMFRPVIYLEEEEGCNSATVTEIKVVARIRFPSEMKLTPY